MSAHQIFTERLAIWPFEREDITDEYLRWLNDKELMRYSRQRYLAHTRESCEEYLRGFEDSSDFFWNIVSREHGFPVGTATAFVSPAGIVANVGLLIGDGGAGYGQETLGAVMAYLFEHQRIRKIIVGTLRANRAMVKIATRWGMRLEEGSTIDHCRFAIFRHEWQDLEQRPSIEVKDYP